MFVSGTTYFRCFFIHLIVMHNVQCTATYEHTIYNIRAATISGTELAVRNNTKNNCIYLWAQCNEVEWNFYRGVHGPWCMMFIVYEPAAPVIRLHTGCGSQIKGHRQKENGEKEDCAKGWDIPLLSSLICNGRGKIL